MKNNLEILDEIAFAIIWYAGSATLSYPIMCSLKRQKHQKLMPISMLE